jgi:hypothetical protein
MLEILKDKFQRNLFVKHAKQPILTVAIYYTLVFYSRLWGFVCGVQSVGCWISWNTFYLGENFVYLIINVGLSQDNEASSQDEQ